MKKFFYVSYTEWNGSDYETITKIHADIPQSAQVAIAEEENWNGCHWDSPSLVYSEVVPGLNMSDEASLVINALQAECIDDENEEEFCKDRSPLQQWLIDKSR